jgi:hypothetical protein
MIVPGTTPGTGVDSAIGRRMTFPGPAHADMALDLGRDYHAYAHVADFFYLCKQRKSKMTSATVKINLVHDVVTKFLHTFLPALKGATGLPKLLNGHVDYSDSGEYTTLIITPSEFQQGHEPRINSVLELLSVLGHKYVVRIELTLLIDTECLKEYTVYTYDRARTPKRILVETLPEESWPTKVLTDDGAKYCICGDSSITETYLSDALEKSLDISRNVRDLAF